MSSTTVAPATAGQRSFRSPNRILARSFRLARDRWKSKHQLVQEKLIKTRKLAAEREASRTMWRERCEQATARAAIAEQQLQQRNAELEQLRSRLAAGDAAAQKKN